MEWEPIAPHRFTWEKYVGKVGLAHTDIFSHAWSEISLKKGVIPIGYCSGDKLTFRPRTTGFAILIESEGDEAWTHVAELPTIPV